MMRAWLRLEAACRRSRIAVLAATTVVLVVTAGVLVAGASLSAGQRSEAPFSSVYLRAGASLCGEDAVWTGPSSPPACWRPYADTSPFNQEIPSGARVAANSARIVARLLGFGPLQHLTAGDAGTARDYGRPAYFNHPGDPVFTVHCTLHESTCAIEGMRVAIQARRRRPDRHRVGRSNAHRRGRPGLRRCRSPVRHARRLVAP